MADEHIPEPFYRVVVTRVEHVRDIKREWQAGVNPPGTDGYASGHGYAEKRTVDRVERELLKQEVRELDLTRVICAVNGIPGPSDVVYIQPGRCAEVPGRRFGEAVLPTTNDVVQFPDGHHEDVSTVDVNGCATLASGTQWSRLYVHRENNGITRTLRIATERYPDEHTPAR